MEFKNLILNNMENVEETIKNLEYIKSCNEKPCKTEARRQFDIMPNKGKNGLITICKNKDFKYTIMTTQGGNPDLSSKVAEDICKKHKTDASSVEGNITLHDFKEDDFEAIVDYFTKDKGCEKTKTEHKKPESIQIKLKNDYGCCNLVLYSTKTLVIQGKASILKLEICQTISLLCSQYPSEDLLDNSFYRIDMLEDDTDKVTRKLLPNSYDYLKGKIIDRIKQSVVLNKIELPTLPDYSCKIDSILIAIEGVLKKILAVEYKLKFDNFGEIFHKLDGSLSFKANEKIKNAIKSKILVEKLESLYNVYNKRRHSLLHFPDTIETKAIIANQQDANILFYQYIALIDETIKAYLNK